jgi:hypothetical protein
MPPRRWRVLCSGSRTAGAGAVRSPAPRHHPLNFPKFGRPQAGSCDPAQRRAPASVYVSSTSTDRLDSPAEPLFLAPKTSTDKLPMQSTVQKHTEATPGDDHPRHRPRSVLLRPNAPTPRPAHDRPAIAPCPIIRASCQCDVPCPPTRDDMSARRHVVVDERHERGPRRTRQPPSLQSAPSTPASARTHPHTCLLECGRFCNLQL